MFKTPKTLMIQGTSSDAGKSMLVTALCRILSRSHIQVAPFKPQNMALNSAVTADGGEIGRAQAVQAMASGVAPEIAMNPVLIKPNTDVGAQVIVNGKPLGDMDADVYHHFKPELLQTVIEAHDSLASRFELVIVEGAGSPAEINLRDRDIANMGFAEAVDCPVIIIADIDKGGVFAQLVGTHELLSNSEKKRIRGFVINRFRGDLSLLKPGIDWLEQRLGIPVLGVIPYINELYLEAEDAINTQQMVKEHKLKVVVPVTPRISNHTDLDALRLHPDVDCQFIRDVRQFNGADLVILAGSKNVRGDLDFLHDAGWVKAIKKHLRYGGKLLGICGGYQMLGKAIHDPGGIESAAGSSIGLSCLDIETRLEKKKQLRNVSGVMRLPGEDKPAKFKGYEIHTGVSYGGALEHALFEVHDDKTPTISYLDGCLSEDGQILGTYIHGLFDDIESQASLLRWSGLSVKEPFDVKAFQESQIMHLADIVETSIDMEKLKSILGF